MKKILSSIIASLLLLGVIPLGLISLNMQATAQGEVIKIIPQQDAFVNYFYKEKTWDEIADSDSKIITNRVGRGNETYFQFSMSQVAKKSPNMITSAKLRIPILQKSEKPDAKFTISLLDNNNWNDRITYSRKPTGTLSTIAIVDNLTADTDVIEIEITSLLNSWIADDLDAVSMKISGELESIINLGSGKNSDPTFRPYIKVITDDAVDPDAQNLEKTSLDTNVFVSAHDSGKSGNELVSSNGNKLLCDINTDTYIRFNINHTNIQGVIESAFLELSPPFGNVSTIRAYSVTDTSWDGNISYNNRPPTDVLIGTTGVLTNNLDITDAVNDAYESGRNSFSICLKSDKPVEFTSAPKLSLAVSDNAELVAVRQTSAKILGQNSNKNEIKTNLLNEHTVYHGKRATVSWKVYDTTHAAETEAYESYNYITKTGEVIRPRWFEGDKSFKAIGTIRSGNATFEKELSLVVQAQDAPNLNAENFNGFIDIGNSESENAHKFDIVRGSNIKRNIVDNQILAYRTLKKDGAMLINLECDPTATNYITIKLWGGDRGSGTLFIAEPNADLDYSGEIPRRTKALEINEMSDAPQFEGGFIYYTYEVPQEYTNGKNNVSLALYSRGGYEKGDSRLLKEQKSDSRGIYACYMTTSPNFNPDDFKEFGEVETAGSATIPPPKYSLANSEELTRQHDKMIENIQAALKTVKMRQVYNDKNYPIYLDGMTTNSTAWKADVFNDSEKSKDIYYADMLSDDMSSLNILRIFATAYENYDELMLSEAEKSELLDRIIIAIDFLVRAQGSNGGFSDTDEKWIGGPNRAPATETEFKNGLLSAVYAANMISDSIVSYKYLEKSIDSDGDGVQDIERRTAWANMFTSMRDYYSADTSRGNIALRLAANLNISQLNNDLAYDINTVESLINAGLKANVPAILKSESVNDYNSDSLVIAGDIANMARRYYFKGNTDKIKAFDTAVSNLYSMVDKYYSIANTHSTTSTVYTELFGDGRNKTETLHYPIDVYAMTVLANPTALKIAEIYLTHGNFEEKELFYSDNKNYYENILDISAMCFNYHDILKNVKQYDISNYSFLMDDVKIDNYAWVDNNTLSIVVKNNDDKIFMSLGKNVTASGDVSMLFHHTTKNYDKHSSAKIFEDWIEPDARGLTHVDYGKYKIISNSSATKSYKLPTSLNLTGTYKDLISGTYYTFGNSSSVTTKVVPTDAALVVGSEVNIPPLTTLVLYGE